MAEPRNTPEGILVALVKKLSAELGITTSTLKQLIDRFVTMNFGKLSSKTHFAKINTYNEIVSDKMTIKVFFKYLLIARIKKIKISITATTYTDRVVNVEEEFNLINFTDGRQPKADQSPQEESKKVENDGE